MRLLAYLLALAAWQQSASAFVAQTSALLAPQPSLWGVQTQSRYRHTLSPFPTASHEHRSAGTTSRAAVLPSPSPQPRSALFAAARDGADRDPIRIIIAGAPASGKGTQCEKIKDKYGLVHLSTGDMLREAVAAGTSVGKKAKEYMDSGRLVPDEVIIGVIKDRLEQNDCQKNGWLLDGFPRTQAQAKALEECGAVADCFIFLNVPDEILVERVVGRRTDPETGKIYHMKFSPPTEEEILQRLVQRSDDTEEKVKVRLEQFHANVDAVAASYESISVTINGNQSPTQVTSDIFDAVDKKVSAKVAA